MIGGGGQTVEQTSIPDVARQGDPNTCANCGHSRSLHFKADAYVPGKCDYGYDLCGCRDFQPGGRQRDRTG